MTYSSHSNPDLKYYSKMNSTVVCCFHLIDPLYSLDFEVLCCQFGIVYLQEDTGIAQSGSTDLRTGQQKMVGTWYIKKEDNYTQSGLSQ